VKITPVEFIFTFEASFAFVTQHDEMVVHSVYPCCA